VPINLDVRWIHGAADCRRANEPALQTHRADQTTCIIRQGKCSSFEAPFMYLLIGSERSLLVDTGAPVATGTLPIRATVDALLAQHVTTSRRNHLIVAHSHAHADHAAWDSQFAHRPDTTVIARRQDAIQRTFAIETWPDTVGSLDLGGRVLTVMPIPGHEDQHIAVHDSNTGLMLTGDTFYPGLLVVNDWPAYRASARRLAQFVDTHDVTYLLGAHIEMQRSSGRLYPLGTTFQPDEHPLQLLPSDLVEWATHCDALGENAVGQHTFASFVIDIR
jgi:hydroxyacylglutathione hydrolase